MNAAPKILFVDDEPNVLHGFQRQFRKQFQIDTADSGLEGLKALDRSGPYAVVVADMRMPLMNGIDFLRRVQQQCPDTVRLMLTGNADQQTAADAVNEGHVFRFLNKPCPAPAMTVALAAAVDQYALVTAERELLSKTLSGSVSLLADVLSILNPAAFGRTAKIRRICGEISTRMKISDAWEITIAATLALFGCITVPEQVLAGLHRGEALRPEDQALLDAHPEIGSRLISRIPRLAGVAEIVRRQNEPFRITGARGADDRTGLAANVLKAAIDFEGFVSRGATHLDALNKLQAQPGIYRPAVVQALSENAPSSHIIRTVALAELQEGMILDEHLRSPNGDLLLVRGTEIGATLRERLISLGSTARGVKEPIRVQCAS